MASNIVVEWLRSLHLGQYSESFIDNGYDDLEICKQIGDPDLDAIGVFNQTHRARLLQSVKTLREEGAASVYFTLEESNDCLCDNVSSKSSRTSSERPLSDKEAQRASPTASSSSGGQELTKFADEYEEGKAELVRIPRMQLRMLLQEKLRHDGIRLACQPYTTPLYVIRDALVYWDWIITEEKLFKSDLFGGPTAYLANQHSNHRDHVANYGTRDTISTTMRLFISFVGPLKEQLAIML
ncbi:Sterile alpha motif domain-containing protein 5 [Habropoda laboriosa]|uniref:Sterile alpha motif domain-containing protein 5 n=1 Tax=Habropoda laboriosa TaxID=597456 RepID=A0A0L7QQ56_9HYME|nr:Sterile alpha motif domain-containing protein 5 [Habropoda laboriosa]